MKWLLILAIFTAIFSEQIDKMVKGKGAVRKVILVFAAGSMLVTLIPICIKYL